MVEHELIQPHIKAVHGEVDSIMGLGGDLALELMRKASLPVDRAVALT